MKKRIKLQYRLILSYLSVIIIPLIALGSIAFYISLSIVRNQTVEQDINQIKQISQNVDAVIAHMENTSLIAYSSTLLQEYIIEEEYDNMELLGDSNIHNYLYSLKSADYDNYTFILKSYTSNITYCNNYDYVVDQEYQFDNFDWIKTIKEKNGGSVFVSTYIPNYFKYDSTPIFSVARQINNNYTLLPLGYIIVNCNASIIDNILGSDNEYIYIMDRNDNLVYPYPSSAITSMNDMNQVTQNLISAIDSQDYLVSKYHSTVSEFTYIKITPYSDIDQNSNLIIQLTLITILLAIIVSFFLSLPLARGIATPIRNLIHNMNSVNKEHYEESKIRTNIEEIEELNSRFNRMMKRINDHIQDEYKTTIKRKDIEYKLLQSQISPHFLFNTLESIRMMAALNDDEDVATMIYNLANLYRYSIRITTTLVPLKSEVEHIYHYIELQKMRFGDKFTYETDIDENAMNMLVPQLILQPLVENSLSHGFGTIDSGGIIRLTCQRVDSTLLITLSDNGMGMDPVRLDSQRTKLGHPDHEGHIGLPATYQRLMNHFTDSTMVIDSIKGKGTTITITIYAE